LGGAGSTTQHSLNFGSAWDVSGLLHTPTTLFVVKMSLVPIS